MTRNDFNCPSCDASPRVYMRQGKMDGWEVYHKKECKIGFLPDPTFVSMDKRVNNNLTAWRRFSKIVWIGLNEKEKRKV